MIARGKRRAAAFGLVAAASATAGILAAAAGGVPIATVRAAAPVGCEPPALLAADDAALAKGRGPFAVAAGTLVAPGTSIAIAPEGTTGQAIVRHVASRSAVGTAYVVDRAGADAVVAVTAEGTRRFETNYEATHPTWSDDGDLAWATGSGLALVRADTDRIRRLRSPIEGGTVFSPVYLREDRLAVVAAAPPTRLAPEGGRLDDLWVHRGRGWRRLTSFASGPDRWVAVRTPVVHRGTLWFVRVTGRATATRPPRFELWRVDHGEPRLVRTLPDERYLAGIRGRRLLWNVPDPSRARTDLVVEGRTGDRVLGCGAVTTEPLDAIDPDRRAERAPNVPPRGEWPELEGSGDGGVEEIAVIVGDFATRAEAQAVVEVVAEAYPAGHVEVTDAATSPFAIRPGVFGALLHLAPHIDATDALAAFRDRLPQYAPSSWIVTP